MDAVLEPASQVVLETLTQLGIEYEPIACDPEYADTAAFCERYGFAPSDSANCIIVASKQPLGKHCACLVLATTRLDVNRKVCALLSVRKASFAPGDATQELTGMMIGGVTPVGLPGDMPLYIDSRVMQREGVIIGGGSRSLKIQLPPTELRKLPNAEVVQGLAH